MLGTQDILFIVLAFCALWFTAFICWLLYQVAMLIKRLHGLVDDVKVKLNDLEEAIMGMKRKFDGNVALITSIADGIKKIMEALKGRDRRDRDED
jgi:predicted PurR-regulated permease PerM